MIVETVKVGDVVVLKTAGGLEYGRYIRHDEKTLTLESFICPEEGWIDQQGEDRFKTIRQDSFTTVFLPAIPDQSFIQMCQHTNQHKLIGACYQVVVVDCQKIMIGAVDDVNEGTFKLVFSQPPIALIGGSYYYGKQTQQFSLTDFHQQSNYFFREVAISSTIVWG